jgi:ATP-binding cassette subfamily B protein
MLQLHRDLAPYLRNHRRQYLIGSLAVLVTVSFMLVSPRILALAIDALETGHRYCRAYRRRLWTLAAPPDDSRFKTTRGRAS